VGRVARRYIPADDRRRRPRYPRAERQGRVGHGDVLGEFITTVAEAARDGANTRGMLRGERAARTSAANVSVKLTGSARSRDERARTVRDSPSARGRRTSFVDIDENTPYTDKTAGGLVRAVRSEGFGRRC